MKFLLILFLSLIAHGQANAQDVPEKFKSDTIPKKEIRVPYNGIIDKNTGEPKKIWYRTVKVKCGYIIKLANGNYVINNRVINGKFVKL